MACSGAFPNRVVSLCESQSCVFHVLSFHLRLLIQGVTTLVHLLMYSRSACTAAPALGPRVSKRWASSTGKPTPRKGRKGHLYGPAPSHPPPTPEEEVRITKRRMAKAERDERMDITLALTPVKTCALFHVNYFIFRLLRSWRCVGTWVVSPDQEIYVHPTGSPAAVMKPWAKPMKVLQRLLTSPILCTS